MISIFLVGEFSMLRISIGNKRHRAVVGVNQTETLCQTDRELARGRWCHYSWHIEFDLIFQSKENLLIVLMLFSREVDDDCNRGMLS